MKTRKFVDSVTIFATGGRGGNGCVSFRREKFIPKGGPNGGDGGKGGSIFLEVDADTDSLEAVFFTPQLRAAHGGHGKGKDLHGRNGEDLIVKVPCGTEVYDAESGDMLRDLLEPGDRFRIARGGKHGWRTRRRAYASA
jgi:GTP-binding protein